MRLFIFIISLLYTSTIIAQESDVILMKNKKGITVKVLGEGTFIKGSSKYGHQLNGFILKVKNDSIYISHGETKLVNLGINGTMIDTFFYKQQYHYLDIEKIDLHAKTQFGGRKSGAVLIESLLGIGSVGFILLETVNGLRSKQSFNSNNRLQSMGIAAGVFVASRVIAAQRLKKNNTNRYTFTYVKAEMVKDLIRPNKDN